MLKTKPHCTVYMVLWSGFHTHIHHIHHTHTHIHHMHASHTYTHHTHIHHTSHTYTSFTYHHTYITHTYTHHTHTHTSHTYTSFTYHHTYITHTYTYHTHIHISHTHTHSKLCNPLVLAQRQQLPLPTEEDARQLTALLESSPSQQLDNFASFLQTPAATTGTANLLYFWLETHRFKVTLCPLVMII